MGKGIIFAKLLFPFAFHMKHGKGIRAECFSPLTLNPKFRILWGSCLVWIFFPFCPRDKENFGNLSEILEF